MDNRSMISDNSRRIAKNTILLYFRMLLLMIIGLFTSRLVLNVLGVEDYGTYNVVGGVVTMFTFITTAISNAISRFLAFEIGRGDEAKLRRVFATSVVLQLLLALLLVLLVETVGLWFLHHRLVIPDGRMGAASVVLHCSLGVLVINLLAVPYNACIIAHERMSAFAAISIVEALLKLSVALMLYVSPADKLISYAVLMLAVALIVRLAYGAYCGRHFAESRGKLVWDTPLMKEMAGFAGWSFFGSSAYVFNTQGVNIAVNLFFGVTLNAARGIASQVENIVKQFVTNFLTAINPQITKSWAAGDREYCHDLVRKGARFSYLVILIFFVPLFFEAELLLELWLGQLPDYAAAFARLTLVGLLVDMFSNSFLTLMLATGNIRRYYLLTGLTSYLCLPLVVLLFKLGCSPEWAYVAFISIYATVSAERLLLAKREAGFPAWDFLRKDMLQLLGVTSCAMLPSWLVAHAMEDGFARMLLVCVVGWTAMALATYAFALTEGERTFLFRKFARWMPDSLFLRRKYRHVFGRRLNLRAPRTYTEKVNWQKLYDRNPLYHTLADKVEVKKYVAERIGDEHIVPTLGVWDSIAAIDWDSLPGQFVLKCTHDSGSTIVCVDKSTFDRDAASSKLEAAMHVDFYRRDREWAYKGLKPRIIAEAYLGADPADYKFFCFDGKPQLLFVATERGVEGEEVKFDFFDMDFRHLDIRNCHPNATVAPVKPEHFELMSELAAKLSEGMPQVRVDFYDVAGKVYFGEYTLYHFSGFVPFEPASADEWMGSFFKLPGR